MPRRVDVEHFAAVGWVLAEAPVGADELGTWVDEVAAWADDGPGLHHREQTEGGPKLCRSEAFVAHHPGLRALLTAGPMLEAAAALLGEPAVLYKEKINYKLPGGAGYSAHQDAPAYPSASRHVSCMVAVDDAVVGNGCLEVASGQHHRVLPTDDRGCIRPDVAAALAWAPVEVRAGQVLWFHSRAPHRSGPNASSRPRRALYPTYNALAEGDLRQAYYDRKQAELAEAEDADRVTVSLIGDFEGRPVR